MDEEEYNAENEEKKNLDKAKKDAKKLKEKADNAEKVITIIKTIGLKKALITLGIVLLILIVILILLGGSDYYMNKTTYETTTEAQNMGNADPASEDYLQTLQEDGANLEYLNDEQQEALQNGAKASKATTQINLEQGPSTSRINSKFRNMLAANFSIPYSSKTLNEKIKTDSPTVYSSVIVAINDQDEEQIQVDEDTETEDATAETEDVTVETEDATAETEDVTVETEDATAETEDATAETEDATAETEDATAETEDATAETEDIIGVITIYRESMNETTKRLYYKSYDEFMQLVNNNNPEVLKYFSINNDNVVIADWHTKEIIYEPSENMPESEKAKYQNTGIQYEGIEAREISYKDFIGVHALSFDFMLSLLVITKDEDFINALAEVAEESDLRFTIFDNITETITTEKQKFVETTEYEKWVNYEEKSTFQINFNGNRIEDIDLESSNINNQPISVSSKDVIEYSLTTTTIDKASSYTFGLTYADSWLATEQNEYNYDEQIGDSSDLGGGDVVQYDPITLDTEIIDNINSDSDVMAYKRNIENSQEDWTSSGIFEYRKNVNYENWSATQQRTITKTSQVTENNMQINRYSYSKGTQTIENEGEKFKELYDTYSIAASMMRAASTQILELLESTTEGTQYLSIFKYLLYKCTGVDYGVTDISDLFTSAYSQKYSASSDGWEQFIRFLHFHENSNIQTYTNSEGVECYKVESDGYGSYAVGFGIDVIENKETLNKLGFTDLSEGALLPVEVIDELEKNMRKELFYEPIKEKTEEKKIQLTQYQLFALTSRCWNYGLTGGLEQAKDQFIYPSSETFYTAYGKYYETINNEDYFGDSSKVDFNNGLYTQYMKALAYAKSGKTPPGWITRRKDEWILFQTGYFGYDTIGDIGYYNGGGTSEVTNGIELYNTDGSVNEVAIEELNQWITVELLNTKYHYRTSEQQNGPFAEWWQDERFSKFQCTWYAFGRANMYLDLNGIKTTLRDIAYLGNAGEWYSSVKNVNAFECGKEPRANALVVWKDGSNAGHVAYVEAVDTINNMVYISHAGSGESWFGVQAVSMSDIGSFWGYSLQGYIYLDKPIN